MAPPKPDGLDRFTGYNRPGADPADFLDYSINPLTTYGPGTPVSPTVLVPVPVFGGITVPAGTGPRLGKPPVRVPTASEMSLAQALNDALNRIAVLEADITILSQQLAALVAVVPPPPPPVVPPFLP